MSERFKTYSAFAAASLTEIYGDRLEQAYQVTANHLESGVWLNESEKGQGGELRFSWLSLPWEAQLSQVNTITAGDFDGDGELELILGMNHFSNQPETGLWRGTPGCHLEWVKEGGFEAISKRRSGILLPNDTKAIVGFDVDGDGDRDVLAGQNAAGLRLFLNAVGE